jgi:transcription initiation factor TFIIB
MASSIRKNGDKKGEGDRCSQCGSRILVFDNDSGERICSSCGLVVSDTSLDMGPEWRTFSHEDLMNKGRSGAPLSNLYYDKGLSTSFDPRDIKGASSEERHRLWRLKKWDTRAKLDEQGSRNLSNALTELDRLAETLHIPESVKEKAAQVYRQALEKDLIRGRTIADFVAASTYAACREAKIPRSLKEIAETSTQDMKSVSRTYRLILKELDIRPPIDYPMKFVPRIASSVGVKQETERLTVEILRRAREEKTLVGKDPRGMAASALYLATKALNDTGTQREIAEAAGTSEVTLRNRLRDLEELFGDDEQDVYKASYLMDIVGFTTIH